MSVPAEEIERFVCQLLGDATAEDLQTMPERQAFLRTWSALGDRHQRRLLSKVLSEVVFDAQRGRLRVVLQAGAHEALAAEAR
jgi:hypothetical protein